MFSEKNCLQSPNDLQTNLAEYLVSEYIDEIRSTSSAGTLAPVSPETNPNKMYQNIPNISPVTSFISDKETSFAYKNMQESSKKLSDSIIQVSKPRRSIDMFDKEYEVQRGKDSSFAHNGDNRSGSATNRNKSPSIHSVSKNSNIESKLNVSTASSSTPKLKNKGLMRTISNKRIKKLNTKVIVNNSKVNPNSEKLTNDIDLKKLTVCFAANSSARIVSNSSKNLETISNNPQKSKSLIKKPSVVKTSDTTKNNLNKSNNILNKTTSKISSNNKTATNISSNLLVKVPVSNLNVNEIEQSHKKPVIVSINEVSSEKMTSTVIPQNKNSDTIISNINFTQSKVSEPVIQRTINLKCQDSESTKKISSTVTLQNKGSTIVSHNNSLQCTVVKPIFKRVINSAGHQNKDSDAIMSTKSCINKDMNYQEDKTKVRITPISIQSSHASDSLVSSPQKDQADIKTGKLTQQKIAINKTAASKSFLGKKPFCCCLVRLCCDCVIHSSFTAFYTLFIVTNTTRIHLNPFFF